MVHINWSAFAFGFAIGLAFNYGILFPYLKRRREKKRKQVPDFFKTGYQNPGDNYPPGFNPRDLD